MEPKSDSVDFSFLDSELSSLSIIDMESYHLKSALPRVSRSSLWVTENFMWSEDDVLGQGTFGIVYKGFRKKDGMPVAVKKFNRISNLRPEDERRRELELLQKLHHENVVKLLAIENDQKEKKFVLVTELCTGNSLHNIVKEPENAYGLPEDDFLLILEHVAAGIKYLKEEGVVHRDLKLGNIMKYEGIDGSVLYKLIDFGHAKCINNDECFDSICGTSYYIHPKIYGCYLNEETKEPFPVTLELWSIGVIIYTVATGCLPFRLIDPKDTKALYLITKNKPTGAISGCQKSADSNSFNYSTSLPDKCQLSRDLKKLITPIIAKLMEVSLSKAWSFEEFFASIEQINKAKQHMIWCWRVHEFEMLRLYPEDEVWTAEKLSSNIENMTSIPATQQTLLHDNVNIVSDKRPLITTEKKPFFLFCRGDNIQELRDDGNDLVFPSMNTKKLDRQRDCSKSKQCAILAYDLKRQADHFSLAARMTNKAANHFRKHIAREAAKLDSLLKQILQSSTSTKQQIEIIMKIQRLFENKDTAKTDVLQSDILNLNIELEEQASAIRKLMNSIPNMNIPENSITTGVATMNTLALRLKDSWQKLESNLYQTLSYKEEEHFKLEKIRVSSACEEINYLMVSIILPFASDLAQTLSNWHKESQEYFNRAENLEVNIIEIQTALREIQERFDSTKEQQILSLQTEKKDSKIAQRLQCAIQDQDLSIVQLPDSTNYLRRIVTQIFAQHQEMTKLIMESKKINSDTRKVIENIIAPEMRNGDFPNV
ncbi:serine/threonine-protein kinase TBK1-like [Cloeon dipterum]|uniref:serine/threonine-protein kinase TBK1-like n=1 Tax=Cloeon dipterum TaxID=197152 RepID=UPI00321FE545